MNNVKTRFFDTKTAKKQTKKQLKNTVFDIKKQKKSKKIHALF